MLHMAHQTADGCPEGLLLLGLEKGLLPIDAEEVGEWLGHLLS